MGTDIQTELAVLKASVKLVIAGPMLPPKARLAILQSCHVIELLTAEVALLRQALAQHFHLRGDA